MSHTDLNRRIDEVLGRGLSAQLLVDRLNNAFLAAGLSDRLETLEEVTVLSDAAVEAALTRLSHKAYDRTTDVDRAARLASRKAS